MACQCQINPTSGLVPDKKQLIIKRIITINKIGRINRNNILNGNFAQKKIIKTTIPIIAYPSKALLKKIETIKQIKTTSLILGSSR